MHYSGLYKPQFWASHGLAKRIYNRAHNAIVHLQKYNKYRYGH